jgi:hypothetical protein
MRLWSQPLKVASLLLATPRKGEISLGSEASLVLRFTSA